MYDAHKFCFENFERKSNLKLIDTLIKRILKTAHTISYILLRQHKINAKF